MSLLSITIFNATTNHATHCRDFFPDLEKLQVQKELHDAVDEMDDVKAAKLAMKLAELDDDHVANPTLKDLEYDTSLNLDKFQSKYTSEDNASFNQLVQVENEKKREKYSHFYPSKEKMLEIVDKKMIEGVSKPVNTWNHTPRSALMYGVRLSSFNHRIITYI